MIEVKNLTKNFGNTHAVSDISFVLEEGKVTGFLGPNGAGKTTTMRCMLGFEKPTSGTILIDGKPYNKLKTPLRKVGAMIDSKAFHKNRSAKNHLLAIATAAGLPKNRINEVLKTVGLESAANKKVGQFSLGMTQRVGIAAALLGEPKILILDEPVNGLDPEGVIWIREFCKSYAKNGGTVFISSHLMGEIENTVDKIIIIGKGKILEEGGLEEVLLRSGEENLEKAFLNLTSSSQEFKAGNLSL
ncbi:MAG: ATP-binding cassette domain-containing protein [Clostridiales Family XIII bacterium]|jgi:ABC-2 type transport system ATP-binding protein|nr:ATP-binding cassette domain-containing protein [Clostridiales Family XIII bacterium]